MARVIGPIIVASISCMTRVPSQRAVSLFDSDSQTCLTTVVRQVLNLDPLGDDDVSGSSYDDDQIDIVEGTLLGNEYAVYRVRRVLTNETHVAVVVLQSEDRNVIVGTEQLLTIDHAKVLYREYHS
jgi:hypothetical protein